VCRCRIIFIKRQHAPLTESPPPPPA
jgi:hypothetical protein